MRPIIQTATGRRIAAGRFDTAAQARVWAATLAPYRTTLTATLGADADLPAGVEAMRRGEAASAARADGRAAPPDPLPAGADDPWLTLTDVAEQMGIKPASLEQTLTRGRGPQPDEGSGRGARWKLSTVRAWQAEKVQRRYRKPGEPTPETQRPAQVRRQAAPVDRRAGLDMAEVRAWARTAGWAVADEGRIAEQVLIAYQEAHPGAEDQHAGGGGGWTGDDTTGTGAALDDLPWLRPDDRDGDR